MAYKELIKNFEKIRSYIREFYVYGFKSRTDYDEKSPRSYDDERRRIESWLGDYVRFSRTDDKKNAFLSIDSRSHAHNPLYKAWKSKSFTDGDITLHFIIFDILCKPEVKRTLKEITEIIDGEYLSFFENPMVFDESTIRKKLKEYVNEGIIVSEGRVREVLYSAAEDVDIDGFRDALDFFCEIAPCGVVGSFLLDKLGGERDSKFVFKHHYITQTTDSDVLADLFAAMHAKKRITAENFGGRGGKSEICVVPLKIYISVQNGRQYLLVFSEESNRINSYRIDYLRNVCAGGVCGEFDALRERLAADERHMWGVSCRRRGGGTEHVEFTICVGDDEGHIVNRLEREKRCGRVEKIGDGLYRYSADVFDTNEMLPWIRTFNCRLVEISFSNKVVEEQFGSDIDAMYEMYGIGGGEA